MITDESRFAVFMQFDDGPMGWMPKPRFYDLISRDQFGELFLAVQTMECLLRYELYSTEAKIP